MEIFQLKLSFVEHNSVIDGGCWYVMCIETARWKVCSWIVNCDWMVSVYIRRVTRSVLSLELSLVHLLQMLNSVYFHIWSVLSKIWIFFEVRLQQMFGKWMAYRAGGILSMVIGWLLTVTGDWLPSQLPTVDVLHVIYQTMWLLMTLRYLWRSFELFWAIFRQKWHCQSWMQRMLQIGNKAVHWWNFPSIVLPKLKFLRPELAEIGAVSCWFVLMAELHFWAWSMVYGKRPVIW